MQRNIVWVLLAISHPRMGFMSYTGRKIFAPVSYLRVDLDLRCFARHIGIWTGLSLRPTGIAAGGAVIKSVGW